MVFWSSGQGDHPPTKNVEGAIAPK